MSTIRHSILTGLSAALLLAAAPDAAWACEPPQSTTDATPSEIHAFFTAQGKSVLTFMGYSGAGYQDATTSSCSARCCPSSASRWAWTSAGQARAGHLRRRSARVVAGAARRPGRRQVRPHGFGLAFTVGRRR